MNKVSKPPKLSIIIVSWNVKPLLERCLKSIIRFITDFNYEIIVIDNNSQDESRDFLKEFSKRNENIRIILNFENIGYSRANNQGLKKAKGEYILFLNPDTEFIDSDLKSLINRIGEEPKWGIVGCQLRGVNNQIQHSVRDFPNVLVQVIILLKLHYLFFWIPLVKKYFKKDLDFNKIQPVDQVDGTFILTKKKLLEKIGSFDESFFLWFEDVDLCYRFKKAGYQIIYYPRFKILHQHGESFGQLLSFKRQKIYNRSLLTYFEKHYSLKKYWPLLIVQYLSLFLAQISEIFSVKDKKKIKEKLKIG